MKPLSPPLSSQLDGLMSFNNPCHAPPSCMFAGSVLPVAPYVALIFDSPLLNFFGQACSKPSLIQEDFFPPFGLVKPLGPFFSFLFLFFFFFSCFLSPFVSCGGPNRACPKRRIPQRRRRSPVESYHDRFFANLFMLQSILHPSRPLFSSKPFLRRRLEPPYPPLPRADPG